MIPKLSNDEYMKRFINGNRKISMNTEIIETALNVIKDVRLNGDKALEKYAEKFDGFIPEDWEVSEEERKQAWNNISPNVIDSLQKAAANIRSFHRKQLTQSRIMEMTDDIISGQLFRPIERVGVYVPGGTASYPSTVLMNAIPAAIAGVDEIIMVTPVRSEHGISPVLLVAADIAGVNKIYQIGGIQAIAALAYGTSTIPKVDKIVGPGNAYVAAAKSIVYGDVGIDMIAGPSEVAIIADKNANPAYIAADLLAQAEHDQDARTFLFSTSSTLVDEVSIEINKQLAELPRKEIATPSLLNNSAAVVVDNLYTAFRLVNQLAPEHLEIVLENPLSWLGLVKNAGSVFLGENTPEAVGDYFGGPNHVLPTSGNARFSSGLSVDDFIKKTTYLYYSEKALGNAAEHIMTIANEEKLTGHARAVQIRMQI
ncbi:histidinol dehydrogenase [Heyndrickxia shackletonii]|uniref:Histidinol dehydrogenase n=2 Tax=Bacillaceae TaxID=186817 RepID=A0A0Q3WWW0_9BACI|nr:histidinol dehydrogenase [Heyndrickxia shackletonii]